MTKAIPQSKAKTAYGLISDVIYAVLDEPKRVDMRVFMATVLPENGGPACGTVGCFAGWVALLKGYGNVFNAEVVAIGLLGEELNYYTVPGRDHVFNDGGPDIQGTPGTLTYARSVAARIRKFQKINSAALRAKKV